ncbi:putative dual specificity phosphatase Yvh1 [Xylona heveae TC161]|uniref:protein-tyrosine-phosphatase n=1 Tax=Xylona heveae (strain CBS 132557 / TC161) TaxID=1328760 RepID=A0A165G6L7_XYLHT|nr:putative dual specificity phosphatase Yvh1 [Xylona heveae TC161]KZF21799.1 putative dual specificity phosphatase Yvh1 [Xylona heveae TC161]
MPGKQQSEDGGDGQGKTKGSMGTGMTTIFLNPTNSLAISQLSPFVFHMGENRAGDKAEKDRNKKWEMAFTARARQIVPGLYLGNVEASHQREILQANHINAIVSLTDARWVWWNSTTRDAGIPAHRHKWVQCADSSTQDLLAHMSGICDFIDQMASPALSSLSSLPVEHKHDTNDGSCGAPPEAILIHCDLGISRSPTIIIAYLMRKLRMQQANVLNFVQSSQRIKPNPNFIRQLQVWEMVGYEVWEDEDRTAPKAPYKAYLEDRAALLENRGLTGNEPLAPQDL